MTPGTMQRQGGTGLRAQASTTMAGSNAKGGTGASVCGAIGCSSCSAGCAGPGGHAVWAETSQVFLRGTTGNLIDGGYPGSGSEAAGDSVRAVESLVVASAVALPDGIVSVGGGTLLAPDPQSRSCGWPATTLLAAPDSRCTAPRGEPALVALSLAPLHGVGRARRRLALAPAGADPDCRPRDRRAGSRRVCWSRSLTSRSCWPDGRTQALCPNFSGTLTLLALADQRRSAGPALSQEAPCPPASLPLLSSC
jgi:hypothetical protein